MFLEEIIQLARVFIGEGVKKVKLKKVLKVKICLDIKLIEKELPKIYSHKQNNKLKGSAVLLLVMS